MNRSEIEAYLGRDWELVAASKAEYWAERKRRLGIREGFRMAEELRVQVLALRPDWPRQEERTADLESHSRVAHLLRLAADAAGG